MKSRRILIIKLTIFALLISVIVLYGDGQLIGLDGNAPDLEVTKGFVGVGARALGMGATHVAMADDYSAVFWNPAQLSYIKRIEIYGGLSYLQIDNESTYRNHLSNNDDSYTRFNSLGLVLPLPTSRGGLAFAFGVNKVKSFDRIFYFKDASDGDEALELNSGGLYAISLGAGLQISPIAALGANVEIWSGSSSYNWTLEDYSPFFRTDLADTINTVIYEDNLKKDYTGLGANFAVSVHPHKILALGTVIKLPVFYNVNSEGVQKTELISESVDSLAEWDVSTEYRFSLPYELQAGAALTFPYLVISCDVAFTDWEQLEYKAPVDMLKYNKFINQDYRRTLRWNIGAEAIVPYLGVKLRAGYYADPLPYTYHEVTKDKTFITFGMGYVVSGLLALDAAVVLGDYEQKYGDLPLTERYELTRILFNLGYRF